MRNNCKEINKIHFMEENLKILKFQEIIKSLMNIVSEIHLFIEISETH